MSFAHLHLHTEFSMLDGAARVNEVVEAAAADGQPPIAITDHGVMYGVVDFYRRRRRPASNRSSASRPTWSRVRASIGPGQQRTSTDAHDAPGHKPGGLSQPDEAVLARLSRGLLLQAADGQSNCSRPALRGDRRHLRMSRRPGGQPPRPRRQSRRKADVARSATSKGH